MPLETKRKVVSFLDIEYVERLNFDSSNPNSYTLISDNTFAETDDLKKALEPFFTPSKGLHVALVCQDKPLSTAALFEFFEYSHTKIDKKTFTTDGWRCGRYVYCSQLQEVLSAFQDVIDCMKALGRDTTNAQEELNTLIRDNSFVSPPDLPFSSAWNRMRAKKLSVFLLQENEVEQECADIRILIGIPQKHFDFFKEVDCFFPSFVEYVVLGISSEHKQKQEILRLKKELEKALEEKTNSNEQLKTALEEITELKKELKQNFTQRPNYDIFIMNIESIFKDVEKDALLDIKHDILLKNNLEIDLNAFLSPIFDSLKTKIGKLIEESIKNPNEISSHVNNITTDQHLSMHNSPTNDTHDKIQDDSER